MTSVQEQYTVSVVIPTYDRVDQLERALRSCLTQTHGVHQVLVCDDGSTDGTQERIAAIKDSRVHWIAGPRAGRPAVPRNRGIEAATGAWIAFLDDDDEWYPEKLAVQFQLLRKRTCSMSCTNAVRRLNGDDQQRPYFNNGEERLLFTDLLRVNRVICSSALVRSDVLRASSRFPEDPDLRGLEDYALWLCLGLNTDISYCPDPLTIYHDQPATSVRAQSITLNAQRDRVLTWLRSTNEYRTAPLMKRWAVDQALRRARRSAGGDLLNWLLLR